MMWRGKRREGGAEGRREPYERRLEGLEKTLGHWGLTDNRTRTRAVCNMRQNLYSIRDERE